MLKRKNQVISDGPDQNIHSVRGGELSPGMVDEQVCEVQDHFEIKCIYVEVHRACVKRDNW